MRSQAGSQQQQSAAQQQQSQQQSQREMEQRRAAALQQAKVRQAALEKQKALGTDTGGELVGIGIGLALDSDQNLCEPRRPR
jgi:hypothetical protein